MRTDHGTSKRVPAPHQLKAWAEAYRRDPPLDTLFPIAMNNGAIVPKIACVCSGCGNTIDPESVRGRVVWSLPSVFTAEATGYCAPCSTITRIDCRVREQESGFQLEWIGGDNRWWRRTVKPPSTWERVARWLKTLISP